ncbi:MAG TPA: DUF4388 domain-containing protein [Vicinamibacteria bacterium]|nr:DUF4388 domain-containing protein [Vicinamibacteria bacterium]
MPLASRGTLAECDVPMLVHELHTQSWTGSLVLNRSGVRVKVTVRKGQIVFASSSDADHRLGPLLIRRGTVTVRQLVDAGAAVAPGKRLGTILIERNLLSSKELVRAVVEQTQEIIYHAFQWTEGEYELQAGEELMESITLNISTPNLILEGIARIESWGRIERGIGGLEARYQRDPYWEITARHMSLSTGQLGVLEDLGTPRMVEHICERSTLSDFEAYRTLWAYVVIGILRRVETPPEGPSIDDEGLEYIASGG